MESVILILLGIAVYVFVCTLCARAVRHAEGRKPFWWCFFFTPTVGIIIVLLADVRDSVKAREREIKLTTERKIPNKSSK